MTVRPLDHAATARALGQIAYSLDKAIAEKKVELDAYRMSEVEQQLQIAVFGEAGTCPEYQEVTVYFAEHFIPAASTSGQRGDNAYDEPQFTWGFRWISGVIPVVSVCVTEWLYTDDELIEGAKLALGAFNPCAAAPPDDTEITLLAAEDTSNRFAGQVHLSFQGYAVPADDDDGGEEAP